MPPCPFVTATCNANIGVSSWGMPIAPWLTCAFESVASRCKTVSAVGAVDALKYLKRPRYPHCYPLSDVLLSADGLPAIALGALAVDQTAEGTLAKETLLSASVGSTG